MRKSSAKVARAMSDLIESLEGRRLMSATPTFVYVETNNPAPNGNAILAYKRNADGSLTASNQGAFYTGGTGFRNAGNLLGPDDSDHEVIASPDGKWLFAVNQGSQSVSTFSIKFNGDLKLVATSYSGGVQPVSLALDHNHLYVANRGDEAGSSIGTAAPTTAAFRVSKDGMLSPIPNSTVTFKVGASTDQVLTTGDGKAFINNFTSPAPTSDNNIVAPYIIGADGRLTAALGGPVGAAGQAKGAVLGLTRHPNANIIYAGLPADGKVGVYTYDATGKLTFVGGFGSGHAAACWLTTSADGKFLYVADSASNSVGVLSLADPLHPTDVQEFTLGGPSKPAGATGGNQTTPFQIAIDPSGKSLYVVSHATNDSFQQGNVLHQLGINADGTLVETLPTVAFPSDLAPATAHPQGIAIVQLPTRDDRGDRGYQHWFGQSPSKAQDRNDSNHWLE